MNKLKRAQEEEFTRQSLQRFYTKYPDEGACLRAFDADCKSCGQYNQEAFERGERSFRCECGIITWRTAGTFFHGLKYLLPSFLCIWLVEERAVISTNKLSKIVGVEYSTTWEAVDRVRTVLLDEMDRNAVTQLITTVFNPVISKRSNLSVGGEHPDFEECDAVPIPEAPLDQDQLAVCAHLKTKPVEFNILLERSGLSITKFSAALSALDVNGVVQRHFDNSYSLTKTNPMLLITNQEKALLNEFFEYIKNFHGISRKHVQKYVASFWSRYWPDRWSVARTLFALCMNGERQRSYQRRVFTSPKLVRMPAP